MGNNIITEFSDNDIYIFLNASLFGLFPWSLFEIKAKTLVLGERIGPEFEFDKYLC
jgi:hypothetical protein